MEQKPEWMNDPLVKDIEETKLQFLSNLVLGSKGKSKKRNDALYDAADETGKSSENKLFSHRGILGRCRHQESQHPGRTGANRKNHAKSPSLIPFPFNFFPYVKI